MKLEVNREVVSDLWPLYQGGEASPASRVLVEAFLAEDQAFAAALAASQRVPRVMPQARLSPDVERRLLDNARADARTKMIMIGMGAALLVLAFIVLAGGAVFAFFVRP